MKSRRGFTLVEVIIALVLLNVGLLALVGGSAVLVRRANEIHVRSTALWIAHNHVQQLGTSSCTAITGQENLAGDVHESWAVSLRGNATRELIDSVSFPIGTAVHSVVVRTRLPC